MKLHVLILSLVFGVCFSGLGQKQTIQRSGSGSGGASTNSPTFNTKVTINGATETTSNPVLDISQTWNNAGVTFTGARISITSTANAADSLLLDIQDDGVSKFQFRQSGVLCGSSSASGLRFGGAFLEAVTQNNGAYAPMKVRRLVIGGATGASEVNLELDAADTLALRNGVNAQAFNVYNTYTDASNYERAFVGWSGNQFYLQTVAGGTGTIRPLNVDGSLIQFHTSHSARWQIGASGNLLANTDNGPTIGAAGANRPSAIYVAGSGTFGGTVSANDLTLSKTITAGGTTGTQTINKASGSVNFAAAAQTLVVTNSLVSANSVIMATVATDDTTAFACKAIPASGQFTLKLNAAATAETRVSFLVTN